MCPTLWNILYDGVLKMQLPYDLRMTFPLLCPYRVENGMSVPKTVVRKKWLETRRLQLAPG